MSAGDRRGLVACAVVLLLLGGACTGDEPTTPAAPAPSPSPTSDPICPLTGAVATDAAVVERPAVAVKVENNPAAYPLSGLQDAEVVFEELVEGGATRFMAIYHCTDARKVGPVRSARVVDPGIMLPITRILAAAGGNDIVRKALDEAKIIVLDEDTSGRAMRRVERPGVALEHTLYADTKALRRRGERQFDAVPKVTFEFGPLRTRGRKVEGVQIDFGGLSREVSYSWSGQGWRRFDDGAPLPIEGGAEIVVDNVLIEQHQVNNSKTIVDIAGNPSIEIANETGRGKAVLLRDGRAIQGRWIREKLRSPVRFVTKSGDPMVFAPGTVWIELVPDARGEIKGSFSFSASAAN